MKKGSTQSSREVDKIASNFRKIENATEFENNLIMSCKDQEHKCTLTESKKRKILRKLRVVSNQKSRKRLQKFVRFHHIESDRRISKKLLVFTGALVRPSGQFYCKTLMDSGCEEIIISKEFSQKTRSKRNKKLISKQNFGTELLFK